MEEGIINKNKNEKRKGMHSDRKISPGSMVQVSEIHNPIIQDKKKNNSNSMVTGKSF